MKCNNINVNVNDLELDVLPPFLGDGGHSRAPEALEEGTADADSFANNGEGSQINDFRFICINNNNNAIISDETQEPETCEECFEAFLTEAQNDRFGPRIAQYCQFAASSGVIDEGDFRIFLESIGVENIDGLIKCLENVGVVFFRS